SLSLGGIDMRGGGTSVVLNNLPATLTAQGARSFAGYYTAGTALDPVSLAADVRPAAEQPSTAPDSESPRPKKDAKKKPDAQGKLTDGAVDWGVRRTFREYVTGDIARGKWTLSAGALDGGALYRFPGGSGTFRAGDPTAAFDGTVRFTGDDGLDLALSGVRVPVEAGRGTLYADVRSPERTGRKVPLVTFAAKGLEPRKGLVTVTEAPAKPTAEGAEALGGMYPKGTAMDPVSVAVALTDDAELPALPDLGSTAPSPSPSPSTSDGASTAPVAAEARDDAGGLPVLPLTLAAGHRLALAAAAAALLSRRRARPSPAEPPQAYWSPDSLHPRRRRHPTRPARRRRSTAHAAAVATTAALGATALIGAPAASAAETPLSGYELTWGIKETYRTYVTGMAKGSFTPSGGAVQADGNGAFTFVDGTGGYDSTDHTVSLGFQGSLR